MVHDKVMPFLEVARFRTGAGLVRLTQIPPLLATAKRTQPSALEATAVQERDGTLFEVQS
jgi:hypothetical protein